MIPEGLFVVGLWAAYGGVAVGALYLLTVLVKEWTDGSLW